MPNSDIELLSSIVSYGLSTVYEYSQTLAPSYNSNYDNLNTFFSGYNGNLRNIFGKYPLINTNASNSFRGDGINTTEITNFIFKKQFGIPNTNPYSVYSTESANDSFLNASKDRQYSQEIPFNSPNDLYNDINFSNIFETPDEIYDQYKFISFNKPYIVYYSNIIMESSASGQNNEAISFIVKLNNSILTRNAISQYYGNEGTGQSRGYNIKLTDYNGNILTFGSIDAGSWLLDCDSGVLTFYDDINTENTGASVDGDNPPRISFWRYEGLIGNNTIMNVVEF